MDVIITDGQRQIYSTVALLRAQFYLKLPSYGFPILWGVLMSFKSDPRFNFIIAVSFPISRYTGTRYNETGLYEYI